MKGRLLIAAAVIVTALAVFHAAWAIAGIAAGFLVLRAAWHFLVSARLWPNRPCFWCKGTGRNFGSNSDRWGKCWFGCDRGSKPRAMKGRP